MGWLIENGNYPYLEGGLTAAPSLEKPYALEFWTCSDGSYPVRRQAPEVHALGCFANAGSLRTLRYAGTAAQWEAVQKGGQWKANAPFQKVICADGEVLV